MAQRLLKPWIVAEVVHAAEAAASVVIAAGVEARVDGRSTAKKLKAEVRFVLTASAVEAVVVAAIVYERQHRCGAAVFETGRRGEAGYAL